MDFFLNTTTNQIILYFLHFLWSFLDGFIFSSFFVAWEVFSLSGWYLSVSHFNFFICYVCIVFWAVLWDNISYFFWKKYWRNLLVKKFRIFTEEKLDFWAKSLQKHWIKIIFISRFVWTFYWVSPITACFLGFYYIIFFVFNFLWILVGILQFMVYWYCFAIWLDYFWTSVFVNLLLIIVFIYFFYLFYLNFRQFLKEKKYFSIFYIFLKYVIFYCIFFSIVLIYYFFFLYPKDAHFYDKEKIITNVEQFLKETPKKVFSDKVVTTNSNPINVVIITENNLDEIIEKINWKKNLSFSSWEINFWKFLKLLREKEPPISDYYHNNFNQNFQYQDFSKTNSKRDHIRFWEVWKTLEWKKIFLGSVSRDKSYAFMINNWILVIWHSIYKNIDLTRDNFVTLLEKNFKNIKKTEINFWKFKEKNYFTDWKIFILEISS